MIICSRIGKNSAGSIIRKTSGEVISSISDTNILTLMAFTSIFRKISFRSGNVAPWSRVHGLNLSDGTSFVNDEKKSLNSVVSPLDVNDVISSNALSQNSDKKCGTVNDVDDFQDLEEMFVNGPMGMEWGGPTRGGQRPEPTRYGDWERKGRASDF